MNSIPFIYVCWIPLLAWTGLFWVCRYLTFPKTLKQKLRGGETWVYIPAWWKKGGGKVMLAKLLSFVVALIAVATSIYAVCVGFEALEIPSEYGFVSALLFIAFAVVISKFASIYAFNLEQKAFYLYIQRLHVQDQKKGLAATMDNLRSRSTWELQRTLARVEQNGSFFKYLKAVARTEKFPKELYTEVVR